MRLHLHPVNRRLVDEAPLGVRVAEGVTRFIGSWKFVVIQTLFVTTWIAINIGFITGIIPFDPFPFILLNLSFSTQAAYAAPLILMANNRSSDHDRLVLEHIAQEELEGSEGLVEIQRVEMEVLERLTQLEALVRAMSTDQHDDPDTTLT